VADLENPADASRRTRLANERTHLAWWRTGLGALAVGIGLGSIAPHAAGGALWPYVAVGVGYALLGIAFIAYGIHRFRATEGALDDGRFHHPHDRVLNALAIYGLALGAATIALLVYQFFAS
jgi:putative membrane protein